MWNRQEFSILLENFFHNKFFIEDHKCTKRKGNYVLNSQRAGIIDNFLHEFKCFDSHNTWKQVVGRYQDEDNDQEYRESFILIDTNFRGR